MIDSTAVQVLHPTQTEDATDHARPLRRVPDGPAAGLINRLRVVGLRCRAARRAPPIEACQLLSDDAEAAQSALDLMMRSLPQALGTLPVLFAPGTSDLSFDEAWLLQLVHAVSAQDTDSVAFLLRSRVPPHARRGLIYLVKAALPMHSTAV